MRVSLSLLAIAARAYAQSASAYTDSVSGIGFNGYQDPTTGFKFGMALPSTIASDFVGQIIIPTNGTGYGGVSLTGSMVGSILVVAWPNDGSVVASLRETSGYTSPGAYTNSSVSLEPISNGTYVNSTHMSYTFLCSGCITGTSESFSTSATIVAGWGMSGSTPTNPSSADGATFVYHEAGFGNFGLTLATAQSADYATWASKASASTGNSTSGNSTTCSSSGTNVTATVSNSTYDYIIAGAGPAGIIAAERLAETGKSVLLIERGATSYAAQGGKSVVSWNSSVTQYDVPSLSYYLTTASDTSEYCTDTASMAGCILGGGTMVNALMFVRPQEKDFNDYWPTGWKWTDVASAADRLYERNPGTTLASENGKRYDQAAFTAMQSLFSSMGWSQVDAIKSPNAKTQVYSYPPWDVQDGLRGGPVRSYLPLAQALPNFSMSLNTKIVRVVRSGSTMSGVEVELADGSHQVINLKDGGNIVLAAGALSTPRILYNSGIGPTEQITTVQNGCTSVTLPAESDWINLPVGSKVMDHPIFTLTFNTSIVNTTMIAKNFTSPSANNIAMFAQGNGPLVQSGQRFNFWTSLNTTSGEKFFQGTCSSSAVGTVRIKLYLTHGLTSTGVLGITSQGATEFTTSPWLNTEDDKTDMATMIDIILAGAKNSTSLTASDSTATGSSMVAADDYTTGSHFVATTLMGASNDGSSVVDTNAKVWGTDNLFIVDAGIHPNLPTGNTQAIVMVVAEAATAKIIALGSSNSTIGTGPSSNTTTTTTTASSSVAPVNLPSETAATGDNSDCE